MDNNLLYLQSLIPGGGTGPSGPTGPTGPSGGGGSTGPSYEYEIGQYVPSEGGVVAHRWLSDSSLGSPTGGTVQNYLVVALVDQSPGQDWSNINNTLIGSTAQSTRDGDSNSNAIVEQPGEKSSAAALCLAYSVGSIDDWYLPAIDELSKIWQNRWDIAQGLTIAPGGTQLAFNNYWSSSENATNAAWYFRFDYGFAINSYKSYTFYVRAVRKFSIPA